MREIKFRAWDLEGGADGMMEWELVKYYTFEYLFENKFLIPMQYTGLKDKNGKEIYEGDILSDEGWGNVVIKWEDAQSFSLSEEYGQYAYDFTVIGNIYENPELINK